jgi:G3E family GTPase
MKFQSGGKMIDLIMLTGFLGAGKTTMLNRITDGFKDSKIGVIINEFSEKGIDGELIKKDDFDLIELNNGSIFCACIKGDFIKALIEFSKKDIEYLFIEASGFADPSNIGTILNDISKLTKSNYNYIGSICLTDTIQFLKLNNTLPVLTRQVEYSKAIFINKTDLADEHTLFKTENRIREINYKALVYHTTYCNIDIKKVIDKMKNSIEEEPKESTNTRESRPKTLVIETDEIISSELLRKFINEISSYTYRIKGFSKCSDGNKFLSSVGDNLEISDWDKELPKTEIVIISSVGIKILSVLSEKAEICFKEPVRFI